MAKRAVATWWIAGLLVMLPGVVFIPTSALALADHLDGLGSGRSSGLVPASFSRTMVALIAIGAALVLAGLVLQLAAWAAALGNARRLASPGWGKALLWAGVAGIVTTPIGIGVLLTVTAIVAWLVGAPDAATGAPAPLLSKSAVARLAWQGVGVAAVATVVALVVARLTGHGAPLHGETWTALALVFLCFGAMLGGAIVLVAAWWGSLFNARALDDPAWYRRLRTTGIVAAITMPLLGLGALIAIVVGVDWELHAPDATAPGSGRTAASPPRTAVPTG